mmetsp:Transcript_14130/g.36571  ORF Transcript_14130/g.36571 Transcript_14130/m.36571 type:complete len:280 (+) Transcript_14130:657-1496(+)
MRARASPRCHDNRRAARRSSRARLATTLATGCAAQASSDGSWDERHPTAASGRDRRLVSAGRLVAQHHALPPFSAQHVLHRRGRGHDGRCGRLNVPATHGSAHLASRAEHGDGFISRGHAARARARVRHRVRGGGAARARVRAGVHGRGRLHRRPACSLGHSQSPRAYGLASWRGRGARGPRHQSAPSSKWDVGGGGPRALRRGRRFRGGGRRRRAHCACSTEYGRSIDLRAAPRDDCGSGGAGLVADSHQPAAAGPTVVERADGRARTCGAHVICEQF